MQPLPFPHLEAPPAPAARLPAALLPDRFLLPEAARGSAALWDRPQALVRLEELALAGLALEHCHREAQLAAFPRGDFRAADHRRRSHPWQGALATAACPYQAVHQD